jgi:hypothetical protein
MQLHLSGFGQIHYNTESVSISASAKWFANKMILFIQKCVCQALYIWKSNVK